MPFRLSAEPIDPNALAPADPGVGARVSFEGRVRGLTAGRSVLALSYEAHGELAQKEGERILAEAAEKFSITSAECIHRTGTLKPGEVAVWIAVSAAHREAAFEGCRYVIEEIKRRLPIWKKERFADGETQWVNSGA